MSAGHAGKKVVRDRRKLAASGRTMGFALGRWRGRPRGYVRDKRRCSHWKTE